MLTPAQRDRFAAHGFLVVPGLLTDQVAGLRAALDAVLPESAAASPPMLREGPDAVVIRVERCDRLHPAVAALAAAPELAAVASQLLGDGLASDGVMLFDKAPHVGNPTPPHQDGFFLPPFVTTGLHVWLALDPCDDANGCLRYLPGSHKGGVVDHVASPDPGYTHAVAGYGAAQRGREVVVALAPGDVAVHHIHTIHRAGPNRSGRPRRAVSVSFYGGGPPES